MRRIILDACSEFIEQSEQKPVFKILPSLGDDHRRVKVRKKKNKTTISDIYEEYFNYTDITRRSVLASGTPRKQLSDSEDLFFIFPTNGFRFAYNLESGRTSKDLANAFDMLDEVMVQSPDKEYIKRELVGDAYSENSLSSGISTGGEIIFFNIPFFFAVRCSSVSSYNGFVNNPLSFQPHYST